MGQSKLDLLQGTLDVMVLQTLETMGSLHGYGIARRIEQVSGNQILLNQGTIYASLVRLQQRGWIAAKWGTSDNNRKAKFYSITKVGQKQLVKDTCSLILERRFTGTSTSMSTTQKRCHTLLIMSFLRKSRLTATSRLWKRHPLQPMSSLDFDKS